MVTPCAVVNQLWAILILSYENKYLYEVTANSTIVMVFKSNLKIHYFSVTNFVGLFIALMPLVPTSATCLVLPDRLVVTSRFPTQELTASATGASSTHMRHAQPHQETSALEVEAQVNIIKFF